MDRPPGGKVKEYAGATLCSAPGCCTGGGREFASCGSSGRRIPGGAAKEPSVEAVAIAELERGTWTCTGASSCRSASCGSGCSRSVRCSISSCRYAMCLACLLFSQSMYTTTAKQWTAKPDTKISINVWSIFAARRWQALVLDVQGSVLSPTGKPVSSAQKALPPPSRCSLAMWVDTRSEDRL